MRQTNLQFHARRNEIINFIRNIVNENSLKAFGITLFPEYEAKEIFLSDREMYENYKVIVVCKSWIDIGNEERYNEYLNGKRGDLIIFLGKDDEAELGESSMGVLSIDNIDTFWKKVITQFKKELLKGAYVVSPNGCSRYYPKHWYTQGAKDAYEKGIIIKPLAGWNCYLLEKQMDEIF